MIRVHVLSPGFDTPNGQAFLFPLIVWQARLRELGLDCRLFRQTSADLSACDVLLVDSKYHRDRWRNDTPAVLDQFRGWVKSCRVVYCDTTDSSGWLQADVLPIVHGYAKAQLLRDRTDYLRPLYGHRPFTDYYHRTFGIEDSDPEYSQPVSDPAQLGKLRLSWNSGLANYSLYGPWRASLYARVPVRMLLAFPDDFTPPGAARPRDTSCRFGIGYPRATVAHQRRTVRALVGQRLDTAKLGRRGYFDELRASKVVVSPFGYGEITLKDFEVLLTGGLLLKADMRHMETWPDLFQAGETMLAYAWDLSDFETALNDAVANYAQHQALAVEGQRRYRAHLQGPEAPEHFARQLRAVIA